MEPRLSEGRKHELIGILKARKSIGEVHQESVVSKRTLYNFQKNHIEKNRHLRKGQGRIPSKVVKRNVDILRKRVEREPRRSMRRMAKSLYMSEMSMRRLVKASGFKSMPTLVRHEIMPGQEARRLERAKLLMKWHKENEEKVIIWSDEKLFYVQTHVNKKNDCFLVPICCSDPTF